MKDLDEAGDRAMEQATKELLAEREGKAATKKTVL